MADGVVFRTTDGGRWGAAGGSGTGGNLTPLQFDENMWELLTRIQALENDPPTAVSIVSFTVIGSQFQVNMSNGAHLGPYQLPIATFNLQGEWVNAMTYTELDIVSAVHHGLYLVLHDHITPASPAVFDPDAIDDDSGSPSFGEPLYQQLFGEDTYIYDLGWFFPGKPGIGVEDAAAIAGHVFVHAVTLSIGLPGSKATLKIAAAADLSFPIEHNDTAVGSVDFDAGETVGTFTFAAAVDVAVGDTVVLIKPTAVDVDARELAVTIKAARVF